MRSLSEAKHLPKIRDLAKQILRDTRVLPPDPMSSPIPHATPRLLSVMARPEQHPDEGSMDGAESVEDARPSPSPDSVKRRRAERNRVSAAASRQRKQQKMLGLEKEYARLSGELQRVTEENLMLRGTLSIIHSLNCEQTTDPVTEWSQSEDHDVASDVASSKVASSKVVAGSEVTESETLETLDEFVQWLVDGL